MPHTVCMVAVRRTISLPPSLDELVSDAAKRTETSFSGALARMIRKSEDPKLSYQGAISSDPNLSLTVEEVLSRLD